VIKIPAILMQSSFEGFHGIIPEILVGKAFQGYSGLLPNNSNGNFSIMRRAWTALIRVRFPLGSGINGNGRSLKYYKIWFFVRFPLGSGINGNEEEKLLLGRGDYLPRRRDNGLRPIFLFFFLRKGKRRGI